MTDSKGREQTLLRKLEALTDDLRYVPPLRDILVYELTNRRPWIDRAAPRKIDFENLSVDSQRLQDEEAWWEEAATSFRELLRTAKRLFPDLQVVRQGGPRSHVDELLTRVSRNQDSVVNAVFDMSRAGKGPDPASIDESWGLFRWAQVKLFAVIDGYWRWGSEPDRVSKRFLNDLVDLPYLVLGLLFDGLLTEEKRLKEWSDRLRGQ